MHEFECLSNLLLMVADTPSVLKTGCSSNNIRLFHHCFHQVYFVSQLTTSTDSLDANYSSHFDI